MTVTQYHQTHWTALWNHSNSFFAIETSNFFFLPFTHPKLVKSEEKKKKKQENSSIDRKKTKISVINQIFATLYNLYSSLLSA